MKIPYGFKNLIDLVEDDSDKPEPIKNDAKMWRRFCWSVMFGGNRTEAEVDYVYEILRKKGLFKRETLTPDWLTKARTTLKNARKTAKNPNQDGKISAINKIESVIEEIETTLKSSDEIFKNMGIDADYLTTIAGKVDIEKNLLAEIASQDETIGIKYSVRTSHKNKIPGVAYTKAILWLHRCGVCLDFIPNNNHSVKFLIECDSCWSNQDFYVVNHNFWQVCNHIGTDIYYSGYALWLYEATKSLIKRKNKEFYKPNKLVKIMRNNSMVLNEIGDMISDIEQIGNLEEILNDD